MDMEKKQKIVLIAVGLLVLVLMIAVIAVATRQIQPIRGEFTPPPFEQNVLVGMPEEPLPQYGKMTVSEDFAFCMTATPTLTGNDLALYVASPATHTVWMLVRIYDDAGNLLGQSGLIKPGEYLPSVLLSTLPTEKKITARVLSYEPETYYSRGSASAELQWISAD